MPCQCSAVEEVSEEQVLEIVRRNQGRPGPLIPILDEVQNLIGWLPKWAIVAVAKGLGIPVADVYGVASFYHFFRLVPPGKTKIQVCMGTACYVRGAKQILESLERKLGVRAGETTADRRFTLEAVRCVGACSLAPVIVTGDVTHGSVTTTKLDKILESCDRQG
jgi:NADH-quinone oxidoreductase subunit E